MLQSDDLKDWSATKMLWTLVTLSIVIVTLARQKTSLNASGDKSIAAKKARVTAVPWRKRRINGEKITVRDTCSLESFSKSMEQVGIRTEKRAATILRYTDFLERKCPEEALVIKECGSCDRVTVVNGNSSNAAVLNGRPFIINAGEGTTGLRYIQTFLAKQGIGAARNRMKHGCLIIENRTGYISDTPVSRSLWQLVNAYPDAIILLTLRDSAEWRKSRIEKHKAGHAKGMETWFQSAPCGDSDHAMDHSDVETTYDVYNAWVACMLDPMLINVYNTKNSVLESQLRSLAKKVSVPSSLVETTLRSGI